MFVAEYLPRLNQVSVKVQIGPDESVENVVLDARSLLVRTSTTTHKISLPFSRIVSTRPTGYSFRDGLLSLTFATESGPGLGGSSFMELARSGAQLWSVSDLVAKTPRDSKNVNLFQFCCKKCNEVVVKSSDYKFIDMPSEFWQEMMDFWHCHKPHEDHHNKNSKNYDGTIKPRPGYIHIGSYYILLKADSSSCPKCGVSLGSMDQESVKLHKWNLELKYGTHAELYPPFASVYYAILDKVNSSAIRKFTFKLSSSAVNIWVLNLGLSVLVTNHPILTNSLKLFYIENAPFEEDEVVEIPDLVFHSLMQELSSINSNMPRDCRIAEMNVDDVKRRYDVSYLVSRHT